MLYCTVQYIRSHGKAYRECITAAIAAASLTTILAQSRAKNVVCGHHETVRTKVFSSQGDFMDRRNFLSASLAASALSLATAYDLPAQVGSAANQSSPE